MTWLYILHVYIQKGTIISEENEKKKEKRKKSIQKLTFIAEQFYFCIHTMHIIL